MERILIIDDDYTLLDVFKQKLEAVGYVTESARSIEEGYKKSLELNPHLYIIDVKLPDGNGLALLKKIHVNEMNYKAIVITGYESIKDAQKAMEYGASSYLVKPIYPEDLLASAKNALKTMRQREYRKDRIEDLENQLKTNKEMAVKNLDIADSISRRLDLILNNIKEAILFTDNTNNIMMMNTSAQNMINISPGFTLGSKIQDIILDQNLINSITSTCDTMNKYKLHKYNTKVHTKTNFMHLYVANIFQPDGSISGKLFVLTDETEKIKAEQLRSGFLTIVSHEFNTPLTSLMNNAALLDETSDKNSITGRIASNVRSVTYRLCGLVESITRIATISRPDYAIQKTDTDINKLIKECINKTLHTKHSSNPERIVFNGLDDNIHPVDIALLSDALNCLLDNALEYSEEESKVMVDADVQNSGKGIKLCISVSDSGSGISLDKKDYLFDWFTQNEDPHTRKHKGLGLGLP
ncbi:MAG: response regulator, partial [Chitinivibrionales bacterium]